MLFDTLFSPEGLNLLHSLYLDYEPPCSTIIFASGDLACSLVGSPYCALLRSGHNFCAVTCQHAAELTLSHKHFSELTCPGGLGIVSYPIIFDGEPLGALVTATTSPPLRSEQLQAVASLWGLPLAELQEAAKQHKRSRVPAALAKSQVSKLAEALGKLLTHGSCLQDSAERQLLLEGLRAWVDTASAAMMISREDGSVLFANQTLRDIANLNNDVLGKQREEVLAEVTTEAPQIGQTRYVFDQHGEAHFLVTEAVPLRTSSGRQLLVDYLKPPGPLPRRLLEEALNLIDTSILILDLQGRVLFANRSAENLLGFSLSAKYRQHLRHTASSIPEEQLVALKVLETGSPCEAVRISMTSPGNGTRALMSSAKLIVNASQEPLGVVSTFVDVTELEQEDLRRRTKEKLSLIGEMSAGMAHELRNPMTVVSGFAQLLMQSITTEPEVRYLKMIVDELKNTVRLIDDFLTLAKPSEPSLKHYSAQAFLEQLRLLVESQCLLHYTELHMHCGENTTIYADAEQLKQVVLNLVKNAIEAMEKVSERRLSLRIECHEPGSVLTIEDTGRGMSEEELSRAGTPFYTSKNKGTGLGLSLSTRLIESMGGQLNIDSILGRGTKVIVNLPGPNLT